MKNIKTILVALSLIFLTALSAFASAEYAASGSPKQQLLVAPGIVPVLSTTKDFVPFKDGSFGISAGLVFRSETRPFTQIYKSVIFNVNQGRITRDGDTLVWHVAGENITIAQIKWWYGPSRWQLTPNASLVVNSVKATDVGRAFPAFELAVTLRAR